MVAVPNRPNLDPNAYALGNDPNWVANFGAGAENTASTAELQGNRFASEAADQSRAVGARATPTTDFGAANRTLGQAAQAGGRQGDVYSGLMGFAQGPQGPSAAQALLNQGTNRAMAANMAAARSGTGFGEDANNIASAQRANATAMAEASNNAAALSANEANNFRAQQLQAFGAAGDVAGAQRGAAIQEAAQRAGQSEFDTNAALQAEQQRDAAAQGWFGQSVDAFGNGIDQSLAARQLELQGQQSALEGRVAMGNTESQNYGTEADVFATREARDRALHEQRRADRGEAAGLVGTVAGAAASVLSDERSKMNVTRRDRGTALENVLGRAGDSGGGGSAGRAKRDYETYQYGGGRSSSSLEDARSRYEDLREESDEPAPVISGKFGARLRGVSGRLGALSDVRSKERVSYRY